MSNGNGQNLDWNVKKHSVTSDDVGSKTNPVWQFVMAGGQPLGGKSDLPAYWRPQRDVFLRASIYRESMWASAVHIAITKAAAQGWELRGEQKRVVSRWQELLLACDGNQSWVAFLQKQLMDYLLTDNGQFFEIVRQSNARGSRIIGLMHLDSLRCLGRDTRVLMADGSTPSILKVVREKLPGPVMAMNSCGEMVAKPITNWFESPLAGRHWLHIKLADGAYTFGRKQGVWTTNDHEFATPDGWVRADELAIGDPILTKHPDVSAEQAELLTGCLLGDASLFQSPTVRKPVNVGIALGQGIKQRAWMQLKQDAFRGFKWSPTRLSKVTLQSQSEVTPALKEWHALWYPNGKKVVPRGLVADNFSPLMLATWYLDDGDMIRAKDQRRQPSVRLSTHGFIKEDVFWLAALLTEKGIEAHPSPVSGKDQWMIYVTAAGCWKLFELIGAYVPPVMRYKLPAWADAFDPMLWDIESARRFASPVESINSGSNAGQTATFCIDVADEHNFVAAGMVVHNCTRTGDPQVPYLYRDRFNRLHELKYYQALAMSDMPDSSEMWYGVGHSAGERAWPAIRKLSAIETYIYEKVAGRRALAVHIVGGMSETSYLSAVTASEQEASQKGAIIYMGATVIPVMGDVAPTLVTIPLASLPDNFNRKEEFDICVLQYADALGIDVQDLQPLTGRSLGTGAQSRVLDDKARGKGLITWRQQFQHMLNQNVVPESVTFYFKERDQTEEARNADLDSKRATTVGALVQSGLLIPAQGQQLLVQWDVVPKELFPQYDLNDKTLADDEKPSPDPTVEQMQVALAQAEQLRQQAAAQQKLQPGMGGQQGQPGAPAGGGSAGYFQPGGGFGGGNSGMRLNETNQPAHGEVLTKADLIDALRVVVKEMNGGKKGTKKNAKRKQELELQMSMPVLTDNPHE